MMKTWLTAYCAEIVAMPPDFMSRLPNTEESSRGSMKILLNTSSSSTRTNSFAASLGISSVLLYPPTLKPIRNFFATSSAVTTEQAHAIRTSQANDRPTTLRVLTFSLPIAGASLSGPDRRHHDRSA